MIFETKSKFLISFVAKSSSSFDHDLELLKRVISQNIWTVHCPLFSRIFIRSFNARLESRENWTPAQNGRLDWVGGGDQASFANPTPSPVYFTLTSLALHKRERPYTGYTLTSITTNVIIYSNSL